MTDCQKLAVIIGIAAYLIALVYFLGYVIKKWRDK